MFCINYIGTTWVRGAWGGGGGRLGMQFWVCGFLALHAK